MPTADELLNATAVHGLVACLTTASPGSGLGALRQSAAQLDGKSLRERNDLVRDALLHDLSGPYSELEAAVRTALLDPDFTGWMIWPVTEAVSLRALEADTGPAFDSALALLADLTPRLTAEFGIRPLLAADLERALPIVLSWTAHPDEHVRRLASEGTRPRLPWARRVRAITDRPRSTVGILDALHRDASVYVRRSVANHLNDLSRAEPDLATDIATGWMAGAQDKETLQLVRHGLRTLVKQGHPRALALLGFSTPPGLSVEGPRLPETTVQLGRGLRFSGVLRNDGDRPARLAIDYVVHYQKANGTMAPKVFKIATRTLAPGESIVVERTHSFKVISTRVHHLGRHMIELQVNGEAFGRIPFDLVDMP